MVRRSPTNGSSEPCFGGNKVIIISIAIWISKLVLVHVLRIGWSELIEGACPAEHARPSLSQPSQRLETYGVVSGMVAIRQEGGIGEAIRWRVLRNGQSR